VESAIRDIYMLKKEFGNRCIKITQKCPEAQEQNLISGDVNYGGRSMRQKLHFIILQTRADRPGKQEELLCHLHTGRV
jgi:hypothetical protein